MLCDTHGIELPCAQQVPIVNQMGDVGNFEHKLFVWARIVGITNLNSIVRIVVMAAGGVHIKFGKPYNGTAYVSGHINAGLIVVSRVQIVVFMSEELMLLDDGESVDNLRSDKQRQDKDDGAYVTGVVRLVDKFRFGLFMVDRRESIQESTILDEVVVQ